ncbi:hypothetical protein INR77_10980 [Erythrobacter sp. SCSIO 43205]|uniref:hypothetical protein n=1 Tax=Erythrobacter sp. SCSIO 43205 TaxID=2779361 RepID=UPI001CA86E08|nr:hypothetical protein [Erythrobacter sp. SCSIO 43205]UAB77331.1 hypothetical protein INR77_10980 [Erythrobacter sp. SCSIO 43205]
MLSLPYFLIALYLGGSAFWDGEIARGFAIIGASYLALGAGISVRSLFKKRFNPDFDARKQVPVMVILAVLMLAASLALMHYFQVTLGPINGMIFALIGVVIGLFSEMSADAKGEDDAAAKE